MAGTQLDAIDAKEAGGAKPGKALQGLSKQPALTVRNERLTILVANMLHNPSDVGAARLANLTLPSKLAKDDDFRHQAFLSAKVDIACQFARANGWIDEETLSAILSRKGADIRAEFADVPLDDLGGYAKHVFAREADLLGQSRTLAKEMTDTASALVTDLGDASGEEGLEAALKFDSDGFDNLVGRLERAGKTGTLQNEDLKTVFTATLGALNKVADALGLPPEERPKDLMALKDLVSLKRKYETAKPVNAQTSERLSFAEFRDVVRAEAKSQEIRDRYCKRILSQHWTPASFKQHVTRGEFDTFLNDIKIDINRGALRPREAKEVLRHMKFDMEAFAKSCHCYVERPESAGVESLRAYGRRLAESLREVE